MGGNKRDWEQMLESDPEYIKWSDDFSEWWQQQDEEAEQNGC